MMNNLQKDLQENVEKYNGKHHLHKRVKVINCYHCYPISTEANVPDNFIRFWDWITIFHSAKLCTSLTLFYFDKVIEARALANANARNVANFLYEDIICRHRCPRKIISDRGTHFNNQVIKNLLERFKIRHNLSTPYPPKTNGLVERFNKTLCESLAKLNKERENWDEYISLTLFAYRTKINKSTQFIPFYLTYGREAILPFDEDNKTEITLEERVEELSTKFTQTKKKALENIEKSQSNQKRYHDRKIKKKSNLNIGDKVLLYDVAKAKQWSGKLEEKWKGPYFIHDKLLNGSYKLKDFKGNIFKTPVNREILKRYHDR